MEIRYAKGTPSSLFSLGTVQLGMAYGLNKAAGKPSQEDAFQILDAALSRGVNWLDTAAAYGDSEAVIGQWLQTLSPEKRPYVVTKVNGLDHTSLSTLRSSVRGQLEQCKENLQLEQIPVLMIHHCEEFFEDEAHMSQVFKELKESGDILYSGVSAYAHNDYGRIADSGLDAVQIPINLFDWRQLDNGGIQKLQDAGMIVHARSVFLQGLVFRTIDQLDPDMRFCADTIQKLEDLCEELNMSRAELAISFARSIPGITSLVIGCRNVQQVVKTADLIEGTYCLNGECMQKIHDTFFGIDERIVTPMFWHK